MQTLNNNSQAVYTLQALQTGSHVVVKGLSCFDLASTLDCGQAFRWQAEPGDESVWEGIAHGRLMRVSYFNNTLTLHGTDLVEYETVWRDYFDLGRDYEQILKDISKDPVLAAAGEFTKGLHLLLQEPWETLCSFIISQNNNIPRIKGIISRLCEAFGQPLDCGGYTFPGARVIAACTLEDLAPLRAGFRGKYILDAAQKVAGGEVDLNALYVLPLDEARESLIRIKGVGKKVADCALLFGLGRIECFPEDVWIKRAMAQLFDGKLPDCAMPYAGIVQQFIFHYARMTKLNI